MLIKIHKKFFLNNIVSWFYQLMHTYNSTRMLGTSCFAQSNELEFIANIPPQFKVTQARFCNEPPLLFARHSARRRGLSRPKCAITETEILWSARMCSCSEDSDEDRCAMSWVVSFASYCAVVSERCFTNLYRY
ncbi:hypothetical protein PUN28_004108 [Cardiocondyla obscurior]|uniref:Uncharacterized protein n=1 Tax=Cardiocondyla obscurior TaxID=286306 RepID=A0AAW2GPL7_9HYME